MAVHLPLLARLHVASPCTADWTQMAGDARARHCGACKQTVYNLSDMTREAAEALLFENNGDLCVRYFARADGTILTSDCAVGVRQARKRKVIAAGVALLASVGAGGAAMYHELAGTQESDEVHYEVKGDPVFAVMGGSAASPPPADPAPVKPVARPPAVHPVMGHMGHMHVTPLKP